MGGGGEKNDEKSQNLTQNYANLDKLGGFWNILGSQKIIFIKWKGHNKMISVVKNRIFGKYRPPTIKNTRVREKKLSRSDIFAYIKFHEFGKFAKFNYHKIFPDLPIAKFNAREIFINHALKIPTSPSPGCINTLQLSDFDSKSLAFAHVQKGQLEGVSSWGCY